MSQQSRTSDQALRGIALMILSCGLLTVNDGLMKVVADTQPVGQIVFVRGIFVTLLIAVLARRAGGWSTLRWHDVRGQVTGALLLTVSLFLYVSSLPHMPLSDAVIIIYVSPIFVMMLAPRLLGERVGWRRWSAGVVGFVGVVLVMRPLGSGFQWVYLLPLVVALLLALRDILVRRIVLTESSVAILFSANTLSTLIGGTTASAGWPDISTIDITWLAAAGILFGLAQFFMIEAFRFADAGLVAPFRYSSILWAILFGYFVWRDFPDAWGIAGIILIIASGLFILHREARQRSSS